MRSPLSWYIKFVRENDCLFTHFINGTPTCTLPFALFLVSTISWCTSSIRLCSCCNHRFIHHLAANFVCQLFGAEQVVYSRCIGASWSCFEIEFRVSAAVAALLYSGCIHVSPYFCLSGSIRSIFIIWSADLWPWSNWSNSNYITVHLLFFSLLLSCLFLPPSYLILLSKPLYLCLTLIVCHYVSYASNRITAMGSYSGRSHCLSVYVGDIHNYIRGGRVCVCRKPLSSAASWRGFVSRVCVHWCVSVCACLLYVNEPRNSKQTVVYSLPKDLRKRLEKRIFSEELFFTRNALQRPN